jgi:hypothetical protein
MRPFRVLTHLLVGALPSLTACGDDGSSAAEGSTGTAATDESTGAAAVPNTLPTLQVTTDAAAVCAAATAVELRATRFGCVSPPPAPCTVPSPLVAIVGDRFDCPINGDGDGTWRVEVEAAGRYYVELVAIDGGGVETADCLSNTADAHVIVDNAAFDTNPTIAVTPRGEPCPTP